MRRHPPQGIGPGRRPLWRREGAYDRTVAQDLPLWKRLFGILKAAAQEFGADRAGQLGAALSYYTIFSLVPLLFLVVAAAGFILDDPAAVEELLTTAEDVAGEAVADSLGPIVDTVADQAGAALTIGLLLAAFAASGIFLQVQRALNTVFHVPDEQVQGIVAVIRQRLVALASALVLAVFVLVPIGAVGAINWLTRLARDNGLDWLVPVLGAGVPVAALLLLMLVVGVTFQAMTRVTINWSASLRGGAFTAVIGLAASYGVGWYLSRDQGGDGVSTLAVAGGLAILLFFFNILWTVYLFGAEVTKVYADYLRYGDILQPTEREERRADVAREARDAALSRGPSRLTRLTVLAETGVFAFVSGWIVGRFRRRR